MVIDLHAFGDNPCTPTALDDVCILSQVAKFGNAVRDVAVQAPDRLLKFVA